MTLSIDFFYPSLLLPFCPFDLVAHLWFTGRSLWHKTNLNVLLVK